MILWDSRKDPWWAVTFTENNKQVHQTGVVRKNISITLAQLLIITKYKQFVHSMASYIISIILKNGVMLYQCLVVELPRSINRWQLTKRISILIIEVLNHRGRHTNYKRPFLGRNHDYDVIMEITGLITGFINNSDMYTQYLKQNYVITLHWTIISTCYYPQFLINAPWRPFLMCCRGWQ